ncbi:MAG: hypothetical protein L0Y38_00115 [Methylococcaceae bacterium]|nr:hypothetical protein [Methylococcaceae bacterium]MCI0732211.1 hypothetical protein [Methylococcaceae bacterium]
MQCYERQAMYLKLYADVVIEIPRLEFDRDLLEDILSEFAIDKFSALIELEKSQRGKIITRIKSLIDIETPRKGDTTGHRDRAGSAGFSNYALRNASLTSNLGRHHFTIFP